MIISDEDRRSRAAEELKRGAPIVLVDGYAAALAASAEMLRPAMLEALRALPLSELAIAVTSRRAETLRARAYDEDLARIALRLDHTADIVKAIADPALDLQHPLLGPHLTLREGDAGLHRAALQLCKRAKLLPAAVVGRLEDREAAERLARQQDLTLLEARLAPPSGRWREVVGARVPIAPQPNSKLHIFRRDSSSDEHYALEIGEPPRDKPVLTRLHSACVTGDLFGSLKCDCGPQLNAAIARIAAEGAGVLVYLLQEGRGIGLANKMRAYRLQDQGFDTVEANHRLGFEDDERLLSEGAEILAAMGFRQARLMTNNPKKLEAFTESGVEVVERIPLVTEINPENAGYLTVKARKSGHLL